MLLHIMAAAAVTGGALILLWKIRGILLTPVPLGKSQRITAVVEISGSSQELEHTVDALLWLIQNGTLPMRIVIADAGMDDETRQIAELLAKGGGSVELYTIEKIPEVFSCRDICGLAGE